MKAPMIAPVMAWGLTFWLIILTQEAWTSTGRPRIKNGRPVDDALVESTQEILTLNLREPVDDSATHPAHTKLPPSGLLLLSGHRYVFAQPHGSWRHHRQLPQDRYP